jgi:hypothetical protein
MLVIQKQFKEKMNGNHLWHVEIEKAVGGYRAKEQDYSSVMRIYNDLKNYYLEVNYAMNTFDRQNYK